jgi:hypothetical protein
LCGIIRRAMVDLNRGSAAQAHSQIPLFTFRNHITRRHPL